MNKLKKQKSREGLCVIDISGGKESIPICAVKTIDDEKPPAFNYIVKMTYPNRYNPALPNGCNCRCAGILGTAYVHSRMEESFQLFHTIIMERLLKQGHWSMSVTHLVSASHLAVIE